MKKDRERYFDGSPVYSTKEEVLIYGGLIFTFVFFLLILPSICQKFAS